MTCKIIHLWSNLSHDFKNHHDHWPAEWKGNRQLQSCSTFSKKGNQCSMRMEGRHNHTVNTILTRVCFSLCIMSVCERAINIQTILVSWVLWHINPCRLFNTKSCLCIYVLDMICE